MTETTPEPEQLDPLAQAAIGPAEVCGWLETAVRAYLPAYLPADLDQPYTWAQLPTMDALMSAQVPAVSFTSPGLADVPERKNRGESFDAVWTVVVGCWVRGYDGTYTDTTKACRQYTKAVRTAVLAYARDHGQNWLWRAEQYDALPVPEVAATLQAGLVQFDVPVIGAVDLGALPETLPGSEHALPTVKHTHVTTAHRHPAAPDGME